MLVSGHSRSLKMVTIRKLGYGFLFAFHSNYGRIFRSFDTMHEHDRQTDRGSFIQPAIQQPHDSIGRA